MAINVNAGFAFGSNDAVDARMVLTKEQMLNINENTQPDVYLATCLDDGCLYIYNKDNKVNAETGKFKVVEDGADLDEYDEETIESWFDLTPEEAEQIYNIINDAAISQYYLWSSNRTNEAIVTCLQDAKLYSEELIGKLANIELEVVSSLPDVGEKNKIYILIGVEKNVLYIWKDAEGTYIDVGDFEPNLEGYLKIDELKSELTKYIETDPIDFTTL